MIYVYAFKIDAADFSAEANDEFVISRAPRDR